MRDQTLSVAPRFCARNSVKQIKNFIQNREERFGSKDFEDANYFVNWQTAASREDNIRAMVKSQIGLFNLWKNELAAAIVEALKTGEWNYKANAIRLENLLYEHRLIYYRIELRGPPEKPWGSPIMLSFATESLAHLCWIGDEKRFREYTALYFNLYDKGYVLRDQDSRIYMLLLRLAQDYCGYEFDGWIDVAYEIKVYNQVIEHWRDEDPAELNDLMIKVCNRHTYQGYGKNPYGPQDLTLFGAYLPLEYFMVQRMREWKGLAPVEIEHVLIAPAFQTLPEAINKPVHNELVEQILAKTRALLPDFDDVLTKGFQR